MVEVSFGRNDAKRNLESASDPEWDQDSADLATVPFGLRLAQLGSSRGGFIASLLKREMLECARHNDQADE